MTAWERRRLTVLLAAGLPAGFAAVILLSWLEPGACPVASLGNRYPAGCGKSAALLILHIVTGGMIAVKVILSLDAALNAAGRRRRNRNEDPS